MKKKSPVNYSFVEMEFIGGGSWTTEKNEEFVSLRKSFIRIVMGAK